MLFDWSLGKKKPDIAGEGWCEGEANVFGV